MDLETIIADATVLISLGKFALEVGQDAKPFLVDAYDILINKKVLTDAERSDMLAREASLRSELQTPTSDE